MRRSRLALFQSFMALLLCFSMLVGTTFAWFTDGVSSGNNTIAAGSLDIEMEYLDAAGNWQKVTESTEVLDRNALWEPGHTEVAYLKITNAGSLALKYALGIQINGEKGSVNAAGEAFKLSDHILFGVVETEKTEDFVTYGNRADAIKALTESKLISQGHTTQYSMKNKGDTRYVTLVVYMPSDVGNAANYATGQEAPEIQLGIQLVATQEVHESDSFGSDYDAKAEVPGFTFPESTFGENASADVKNENNQVAEKVDIQGDNTNASIPAGVKLEKGVEKLTLEVSTLENSEANINLGKNEEMRSLNVHVEGVAADNTVPMEIHLTEATAKGLNAGNLKLYHVENGVTVEMELVGLTDAFTAHNQFKYDPATGDITLYMATFSEVALVADTTAPWGGNFDHSWYKNKQSPYSIANADQLWSFSQIVGGMASDIDQDSFNGKTVKLVSDINLDDAEDSNKSFIFYPIGYYNSEGTYEKSGTAITSGFKTFEGVFDGQGHSISNFYQNTWEMKGDNEYYDAADQNYRDGMGLFGKVYGGTVQNLTVKNFKSDGEYTTTGVIAAYADSRTDKSATFENIAIIDCNPRVYNIGNGGIVGCGGWYSKDTSTTKPIVFKNITVDKTNKISALWGSYDVACGGIMGQYYPNSGCGVAFENCNMAAQMDVYNDVCGNYQYYAYRYAGMMIGSIRENLPEDENGHVYPNMKGITAKNCTVNYGDWNDYYYCEFVKNGHPSYFGPDDYKFSRVPNNQIDTTNGKENATCIGHDHDGVIEDNQAVYLPFSQLFTGYGWGVTSMGIKDFEGIDNITITESEQNESVVKFETKFTGNFLYRVGNQNTVSVGSLFEAFNKDVDNINDSGVYVRVDKVYDNADVTCKFTANTNDWTQGTLQFTGTGVVDIVIQDYDYCTPTTLHLEVVDAYNRTTASFSGNSVLLNDVSTSGTLSTSGIIYGNGFTVNMENAPISEKNGAVFHLYDGAILKNLNIVGKEYTTVSMNVNDTNYGVSAVRAWGTVVIENCYISGCRSAVSVTGTELTIKDSVIANGIYANVDFRSGILNLHNVTTINEPHAVGDTTVVGLGIVGNMTASAGRQLNITGTLTQYNWVSQKDCENIKASGVDSIFNSVFAEDKYSSLRYTYNGTTYVNTGILSLCSDFIGNSVTGLPSNYSGMEVSATIGNVSGGGYVWAPAQPDTLTDTDMKYHGVASKPGAGNQGTSYIPPAFAFANSGLEVENGVVQISYESGSSYTLSNETLKSLLTAEKYGQPLSYTIKMDGTDYTNSDITFSEAASRTYTIIYTITDNLVFDENGNLTGTTYEVTKELKVFATVVDRGADAPTFTFYYGTNGSASADSPHVKQPTNSYTSTIKQVGDAYYIMPNVSATSANAIGSKTVDGVTVYYPIVDGINVRSGSSTDYDFTRYYPIFKAVTISDNGTEYSYSVTKEMPSTVTWDSAEIDSGNGASSLNDGSGLYNNQYLCKIQKKAGDEESGGTSVVKYSYVALDGNKYSYYVGYRFYDEDEGGLCFTADTEITLADGTQKRVDELTFEDRIIAWDFFTGTYAEKDVVILVNHGEDTYNVANLQFSDGTNLRLIGKHGVFDYDLNKFVYITVDNMQEYVGHRFVKYNADGKYDIVTLNKAFETEEVTSAYSITSAGTSNAFASGMLTVAPPEDFYNWIEMDGKLHYDVEQFNADVEQYGLYTYDVFADYVTYEQFVDWNGAYLKIAVEKGYFTFDYILELIELYKGWMPNN